MSDEAGAWTRRGAPLAPSPGAWRGTRRAGVRTGWLADAPAAAWWSALGALLLALLVAGAALRCFEYDETYTHALLAGLFRPQWPLAPVYAGEARAWFDGGAGDPAQILSDLVRHDTHPPLYFWLMLPWRGLFGPDPFVTRLPSVLLTLGSAAVVWRLALAARVPPLPAVACAGLAYGVLYMGVIARAYALALLLVLAATLLLARVLRDAEDAAAAPPAWADPARAAGAGALFGLAMLCHYLAGLTAAALLAAFGLTLLARRRLWPILAAGAGLAPPFLFALWIRRSQGSADWHLAGFDWLAAPVQIARGHAAALFGGTPLYAPPGSALRLALTVLVVAALLLLAGCILLALRRILADPVRRLLLAGALGGPVALLAMGAALERSPFEFRYFVFGVPYLALLFAAGLAALAARVGRGAAAAVAAYVLGWQLVGAAAMPVAQETQQDYRLVVRAASPFMGDGTTPLLVPIGYDGVGMNGPFAWEAPPGWPLRVIRPTEPAEAVVAQLAGHRRLVLTTLADGVGQAAVDALRPALAAAGWRITATGPFLEVWAR